MPALPLFRAALCASALAIACGSSSGDGGSGNPAGGTSSGSAGNGNGASGNSANAGSSSAGSGTSGSGNAMGGSSNAGSGAVTGGSSNAGSNAGGTANAGSANAGSANGGASNGGSANGTAGTAGSGGTTQSGDLWIATDGSDSNPGSEASPLLNLPTAVTRLTGGHSIFIKAGSYKYTNAITLGKRGTQAAPFTISAAPGARPTIDFATALGVRGFDLQGDYWHIVGFEVENAGDNCIAISGSHNTIENMTIHGCQDTGLQITVSSANVADNTRGAYNTILNCDSYENFDQATNGENADGFAAKLRIGPGNAFKGCRAYNNSDDGWDFFAADDVVTIDGSWAFANGKGVNGNNPAGDGNGFKLGGKPTSAGEGGAVHLVTGSFAFENLACGYTQNSNPDVPKLSGCGAKDNGQDDYCQTLTRSSTATMTMTAAQAKAVKRNADGSLPPMK